MPTNKWPSSKFLYHICRLFVVENGWFTLQSTSGDWEPQHRAQDLVKLSAACPTHPLTWLPFSLCLLPILCISGPNQPTCSTAEMYVLQNVLYSTVNGVKLALIWRLLDHHHRWWGRSPCIVEEEKAPPVLVYWLEGKEWEGWKIGIYQVEG